MRAATNEEKPGTEDESTVKTVTVLLFDEMNTCLGRRLPAALPSAPEAFPTTVSDAMTVPAATKKIFAVINPSAGWDFSVVGGKTWTEINTLLADAAIDNVTAAKNFMMASAGDFTKGALTGVTP